MSDETVDDSSVFFEACKVILAEGYTPVRADAYQRLRAWLDETNGWPPHDWVARNAHRV